MERIVVYLIPFAGGSAYAYNAFRALSSKDVVFCPVELPGRGGRFNETLIDDLDGLCEDLFLSLKNKLETPYAIFGHSMGTLLGYKFARMIIENNMQPPLHLFLSGREGPSVPNDDELRYLMNRQDFFAALRDLGGMPEEILNDESMMNFFEPILRSDFKAVETFAHSTFAPLDISITAFYGSEEHISEEEIQAWQLETTKPLEVVKFIGGHFFIFDHAKTIASLIIERLRK